MSRAQHDCSDVKAQCERKLAVSFREGKEYNGWYLHDGKKIRRVTVPKGRKPLKPGTYANMARQLALTSRQLDDLLDCPLNLQGYVAALKEQNLI